VCLESGYCIGIGLIPARIKAWWVCTSARIEGKCRYYFDEDDLKYEKTEEDVI
jgi:hypothetical protein